MHPVESDSSHALMIREKQRVALTSVLAAVLLTGGKLGVGLWTGSLGILSEALHSGLDLLAAAVTWFAVRAADRPADEQHQYGHGKIENLSALFETLLLLLTCVWILYEAFDRLLSGHPPVDVNVWSFVVIAVSIVVDFSRSRALMRVARKYDSQALEADALHFSTDIYSSMVVLVGLLSVSLGFPAADSISAAVVALIVVWISVRLGRRTIDALLDRVPEGLLATVTGAVERVPGVENIRSIRVRSSGAMTFVNLVIGVRRTAFFAQVHDLLDLVEERVHEVVPRTDVLVHAEPVPGARERIVDVVEWLVRRNGLSAHNIMILRVQDTVEVSLDIEFPHGTSFSEAHEHATDIESAIHREIPEVSAVRIHLEEERAPLLEARTCTGASEELAGRICSTARAHPAIRDCGDVCCYDVDGTMKITLRLALPAELSLRAMHSIVDSVENEVRALDARIGKVFIHAEPATSTE